MRPDGFSFFDDLAQSSASAVSSQGAMATGQAATQNAVDASVRLATSARSSISQISSALLGSLGQVRTMIVSAVSAAAAAGVALVSQGVTFVVGALANLLRGAVSVVRNATGMLVSLVGDAMRGLVGSITNILGAAAGVARTVGGALLSATGAIVRTAFNAVTNALSGIISSVTTALSGVLSTVSTVVGPIAIVVVGILYNFALLFISRLLTAVSGALSFVGRVITQAVPVVISAAQSLWGYLSGAIVQVGGVLRNAFSLLLSWGQSLYTWAAGLASRAAGFIGANAGGVTSMLSTVVSGLANFGGALLRFVPAASVVGVFATAVAGAAQQAISFAQAAKSLSGLSGYGLGQSAGLLTRYGAQGVGPESLQALFGSTSPLVLNLKARAFGLPNFESANFGGALAGRYQSLNASGPLGPIQAQAMLRALGLNSQEFQRLANTSPATQQQNAAFSNRINASLGLSPDALARYSEVVPAALTRIGSAVQAIVLKLAGEALPLVEQTVDTVSSIIGANAPKIGAAIGGLVKWITTSVLPVFLSSGQALVTMGIAAFRGFVGWANWFLNNIQDVLTKAVAFVTDVLNSWLSSFAQWAPKAIEGFATFLEGTGNSIADFVGNVGAFIVQGLTALSNWMQNVWSSPTNPFKVMVVGIADSLDTIINGTRSFVGHMAQLGAVLNNLIWINPIIRLLPQFRNITYQSPSQAYANATAGVGQANIGQVARNTFANPAWSRGATAIANNLPNIQATFDNLQSGLRNGFNTTAQNARTYGTGIANGILNGGNAVSNFLSPAGQPNIGSKVGGALAENTRPYVEGLSALQDGISSITGALGNSIGGSRLDRNSDYLRRIADGVDSMKDNLQRTGSFGNGFDAVAGAVLSEYAAASSAAIKRRS